MASEVEDVVKTIDEALDKLEGLLKDLGIFAGLAKKRVEPLVKVLEIGKRAGDLAFALIKMPYELLGLIEMLSEEMLKEKEKD